MDEWPSFESASELLRAGLFSFFSSFSLPVALVADDFCELPKSFDCFDCLPEGSLLRLAVTETAGGLICDRWPSFRLRLESLRSLRADEKPLLELVRFETCDLLDELWLLGVLSLLKSFSLSSIECLVAAVVAVATIGPLAVLCGMDPFGRLGGGPCGLVGILHCG